MAKKFKINKILVPTDFSEPSFYGLDTAAEIAKKSNASIHIINVTQLSPYFYTVDPLALTPPPPAIIEPNTDEIKNSVIQKIENLKKRKSLAGIKVIPFADINPNIHLAITNYAESIKADLIVMGSRGAGNLKEIILGSNAERVVRFSKIPVFVVPEKIQKSAFTNIVFASDFENEAYSFFPFVYNFAGLFSSHIHLLKIITASQFSKTADDKQKMYNFAKKFKAKYTFALYNDYMKEEGILNYAREVKADLIAIGTHGKKGLKRFFSEDVSEGLVRISLFPLLIVNKKS
jgi:nucleotide-binding universal stress UspA family protein